MKTNGTNFVRRLQMGKEDALEYIVDEYLPLVKGISYKILGPLSNEGLLEECINDIFLSIWNNAGKFKGDAIQFKSWVAAISKFKAIDYYRKAVKIKETGMDSLEFPVRHTVEVEIIQAENEKELMDLIHTLKPVDQKIVIMRFFLGMHSSEIAESLGLSKSAVDSRIFRARKKLSEKAEDFMLGGKLDERYL